MLKKLLLEIVSHYITTEKKSYSRSFVYFFVLLGLALLIVANSIFFYKPDIECDYWMVSGTLSIAIAVIIECLRYCRKKQESHQVEDIFNQPIFSFLSIILSQLRQYISIKTIFKFLPTIIRFIPASVLTLVIYKIIKKCAQNQIKKLLFISK